MAKISKRVARSSSSGKKAGKKAEELKIIWEPSSKQQQRTECALPSSHFTIFHSVFPFAVCRCCCWLASLISDKHSMQLKSLGNAIFHSFVWQHATCCPLLLQYLLLLCVPYLSARFVAFALLLLSATAAVAVAVDACRPVCQPAWATVKCNYGWHRHSLQPAALWPAHSLTSSLSLLSCWKQFN